MITLFISSSKNKETIKESRRPAPKNSCRRQRNTDASKLSCIVESNDGPHGEMLPLEINEGKGEER